ncbi:MAG: sulfate/molybdate ABC transporter ATP-binding protein [Fusicatenibacter sp.]|nr:sulfate/molybdate ABC transporter ATP-binding protein [Fusicatenibacter sp.]
MSLYVEIEKKFTGFCLNVKLEAGDETLALLGASGCGKSMTLKCIAGIEKPDAGKIVVDGITLFDSKKKINLTPQERKTGLMFQNYALFPNMTVYDNIRAGASREKNPARKKELIRMMTERFGIVDLCGHYPYQLSGGQQQRVALARMLISNPGILLMDEPFSALDAHLRFQMEQKVREVIREFGKTVVLVSHDRDEVFRMSDKIAVMHDGAIEACGSKSEVFDNPKTRNSAILTGCKNISRIRILDEMRVEALDWGIQVKLSKPAKGYSFIGIRMHDIVQGQSKENRYCCKVVEEIENPFSYTIMVKPKGAMQGKAIGWEMEKSLWKRIRAQETEISLPKERILLLK